MLQKIEQGKLYVYTGYKEFDLIALAYKVSQSSVSFYFFVAPWGNNLHWQKNINMSWCRTRFRELDV